MENDFPAQRNLQTPGRRSSRAGPTQSRIRLKVYYLPDASELPSSFALSNNLVMTHMRDGFGKYSYLYSQLLDVAIFCGARFAIIKGCSFSTCIHYKHTVFLRIDGC